MAKRAKWESLGGCLRPWRDGRLRALLARVQQLRESRGPLLIAPRIQSVSTSAATIADTPRPWLDDRLKRLVDHIEQLRRSDLMKPAR
jgi:hypothetical protein